MKKGRLILLSGVYLFVLVLVLRFWSSFIRGQSDTGSITVSVKASVCGNNIIEGGEDCEGEDLNGQTCVSLGYASGTLTCDIACSFDTSDCVAPSPTPTPTPTATPTLTPTPTPTPTLTSTPVLTATSVPGATSTPVAAATATSGVTATLTPAPTVLPAPAIPAAVSVFDVDNSGRIETKEVYEAVKLWVEDWKKFLQGETGKEEVTKEEKRKPKKCDLNADRLCNLVDFSILVYYVNR